MITAPLVVGTLGKLMDWLERDILQIDHVRMAVFEEADHLFEVRTKAASAVLPAPHAVQS